MNKTNPQKEVSWRVIWSILTSQTKVKRNVPLNLSGEIIDSFISDSSRLERYNNPAKWVGSHLPIQVFVEARNSRNLKF